MDPVKIAATVVSIGLICLLLYNLIIKIYEAEEESITEAMVRIFKENPLIVFVLGVIYGHIFWWT